MKRKKVQKSKPNKEINSEANYLAHLLNHSLKQAEECTGTIRDFFLSQSMRLEEQIKSLGFSVTRKRKKK